MPPDLIATLGPASLTAASTLVQAGATALRLNSSHMTPQELHDALRHVRAALSSIPIIVDLQGAKMRLGSFPHRPVERGDRVQFSSRADASSAVPVPHPELFRAIQAGHTLSVDDGRILLRVEQVSDQVLLAECLQDGVLRPRKGINLVEHPVALDDLTETDQQHVQVAIDFAPISFAISFMTNGRESDWVRHRAPGCPIIGKVERAEAIRQIDTIALNVDVLWICRGDLGAQLGPVPMAKWMANFRPPHNTPTLLAGQVLEHLTSHASPTRSEVCHLYDVMLRGYSGFVLSDETAIGCDPAGAVRVASRLLLAFGSFSNDAGSAQQ